MRIEALLARNVLSIAVRAQCRSTQANSLQSTQFPFMGIFSVILLLLFFSSVVISLSGKENLDVVFVSLGPVMLQEDLWLTPVPCRQG